MKAKIRICGAIVSVLFFVMTYGSEEVRMANAAEKTVKVGALVFATGGLADCGLPMAQGHWDYTKWINGRGGLEGVKVDLKWEDHKYEPGRVISAYKRLVDSENVLGISSLGTMPNMVIANMVMEDKIPVMAGASGSKARWPVKKYWFMAGPSYSDQMRGLMKWAMEHHWKKKRPARVGYVSLDNDYGHEGLMGLKSYAKEAGFEVVSSHLTPVGNINFLPQVSAINAADANYLISNGTLGLIGPCLRDAQKVGLLKTATPLASFQGIDDKLGPLSEEAVGTILYSYTSLWQESKTLKGMDLIKKLAISSYPKADPENPTPVGCYANGIAVYATLLEGIRLAIKNVGFDKLTREEVLKGLESIRDYNVHDMYKIKEFTEDNHSGSRSIKIVQYVGAGKFEVISDWIDCPLTPDWERRGERPPQ